MMLLNPLQRQTCATTARIRVTPMAAHRLGPRDTREEPVRDFFVEIFILDSLFATAIYHLDPKGEITKSGQLNHHADGKMFNDLIKTLIVGDEPEREEEPVSAQVNPHQQFTKKIKGHTDSAESGGTDFSPSDWPDRR